MKLTTTKQQTTSLLALGCQKPKRANYTIGELFALIPNVYYLMQTQDTPKGDTEYVFLSLHQGKRFEAKSMELVNALYGFVAQLYAEGITK